MRVDTFFSFSTCVVIFTSHIFPLWSCQFNLINVV